MNEKNVMKNKLPYYLIGVLSLMLANTSFAQYRLPAMQSSSCSHGDFIQSVVFGNIRNANSGCAGYGDYTSQSTTLEKGSRNTIAITINSEYHEGVGVFIDWNQDYDFTDEGEFFSNGYVTASGETETLSIVVPGKAKTGTTRMRVVCQYGSAITSANSCKTTSNFGEYEDYSLVIRSKSEQVDDSIRTKTTLTSAQDPSVESPETVLLEVYPNPTSNKVEVNTNLRSADFTLTDVKGALVRKGSLESGMSIDLSDFHPGVYSLNVVYKDKTMVKRIVKQ